jgi:trans-2,3-dihydro-3-hydroxyanthranilate isomerase
VASLRYVVADVFTDRPLTGNQLAVFTDGREVDDDTMQRLAKEMNFSETVFVLPAESGGHARVRIFTPATELPTCLPARCRSIASTSRRRWA